MLKQLKPHIEWIVFLGGLIAMALMDPLSTGHSLCLFEAVGFKYCLGEGLGHSIAFLFRGEFYNAIEANFMGPVAVVVLSSRIISLWIELFFKSKKSLYEAEHV